MQPGQSITLLQPDDWHVHLRDGAMLHNTVAHTARQFGRAVAMPNLKPPLTTTADLIAYEKRIRSVCDADPSLAHFKPLLTLYLTDHTTPDDILQAHATGRVIGCKWYPAGATTHSAAGVTNIHLLDDVLAAMASCGMVLQVHGEVTDPNIDIFDRESVFITTHLQPLMQRFPTLRVVLEHISTEHAVRLVQDTPHNLGATITAHHLLLNRNALLAGGMRPHNFCLPIIKTEADRRALVYAATSNDARFFLGTDSAPHSQGNKECACAAAGIYTAHAAIELYAEVFDNAEKLDRLEGFASRFGADFYRLPYNTKTITLQRAPWHVPAQLPLGETNVIPFRANDIIPWQIVRTT